MEDLLVKQTRMRGIIQCVVFGFQIALCVSWKLTKAEIEVQETHRNHEFAADSDGEEGEKHQIILLRVVTQKMVVVAAAVELGPN